ncbi:hypothetical protein D3C81_1405000 [compost metagenome]
MCTGQGEGEAAVGGHHAGANDGAIGAAHGHAGTRFTQAGEGQAIVVEHHIGQWCWWGEVGCIEGDSRRGVARCIHLAHTDGLAGCLWGIERDRKPAIGAHGRAAYHGAGGVAYLHGRTGFATA